MLFIILLFVLLFIATVFFSTFSFFNILENILAFLCIVLLLWIWFGTGYKIEDGHIKVKYGPFKKLITIKDIRNIGKKSSPFIAPALSIDRMEITYGKYETIEISPKDQRNFIIHLIKENPNIVMRLTKSKEKKS